MFKSIKRLVLKMFRELIVYHYSSLEYRAKLLTLMVSANGEICECEQEKLEEIATTIYPTNNERAELLIDTVHEYHTKIITNNGLDFEHLIQIVVKETKENRRFSQKIDITLLKSLHNCVQKEDDALFQERILEFLVTLKEEHQT